MELVIRMNESTLCMDQSCAPLGFHFPSQGAKNSGNALCSFRTFLCLICSHHSPNPNFPRVWRTPYLLPLNTRPSRSGILSCFIPHPLSLTLRRKYPSWDAFLRALPADPGGAFLALPPPKDALPPLVSKSSASLVITEIPRMALNSSRLSSSMYTLIVGKTPMDSQAS